MTRLRRHPVGGFDGTELALSPFGIDVDWKFEFALGSKLKFFAKNVTKVFSSQFKMNDKAIFGGTIKDWVMS